MWGFSEERALAEGIREMHTFATTIIASKRRDVANGKPPSARDARLAHEQRLTALVSLAGLLGALAQARALDRISSAASWRRRRPRETTFRTKSSLTLFSTSSSPGAIPRHASVRANACVVCVLAASIPRGSMRAAALSSLALRLPTSPTGPLHSPRPHTFSNHARRRLIVVRVRADPQPSRAGEDPNRGARQSPRDGAAWQRRPRRNVRTHLSTSVLFPAAARHSEPALRCAARLLGSSC